MSVPQYSVVVPAYQAVQEIFGCVRALCRQTLPRQMYEIIVVDDGSTDGTAAAARAAGADQVLVIPHSGPAAARNAGLEVARGEIVLFTDADCQPSTTWLERMVAPFADATVAGVKGVYRTRQRAVVARLVQLEYEYRYERMARVETIDFVDAYSAAYRRHLITGAGGFDPAFPVPSAEDVDLSFRLARNGHRLIFVPQAWVWHRHPNQLRTYLARKARYGFWRALLYLRHPQKIRGDAHTDPRLKAQFVLLVLTAVGLGGGIGSPLLAFLGALSLGGFVLTLMPFVWWAWKRDPTVALLWPLVQTLRVGVQGIALFLGLVYHGLMARGEVDAAVCSPAHTPEEKMPHR